MTPLVDRLRVANAAIAFFAPETTISVESGRVVVRWRSYRDEQYSRRWQCHRGQDFYPTWSRKWGHGGTCCTALSQLVRFVQEKPVLPMSTWEYWCSPKIALARDRGDELVKTLRDGGYPIHVPCVLCKQPINGGLDWWNLNGVSGPCCGWTTGCRQRKESA